MILKESDRQIFVTSLNKLDNPRCKEIIHGFIVNNEFLNNQAIVEKLKEKKAYLEKLLEPLSFEEQAQTVGPFAALGAIKEILEASN